MPRNNQTGSRPGRFADATNVTHDATSRRRAPVVPHGRGEVRIIGGEWRGRKVHFPPVASLRPTPDRVRETLFNWLQMHVHGSRCLDLFAGSGALGIEALSRGASEVTFVERDPAAAKSIEQALGLLGCARGHLVRRDAFDYLAGHAPHPFDIVFLDPPYDERWLAPACGALERGGWARDGSWIYLENAAAQGEPPLPETWVLVRSKRAGDVGYHLARRQAP